MTANYPIPALSPSTSAAFLERFAVADRALVAGLIRCGVRDTRASNAEILAWALRDVNSYLRDGLATPKQRPVLLALRNVLLADSNTAAAYARSIRGWLARNGGQVQ